MDTAIDQGDFAVQFGGIPKECDQREALLQQVYLRLKARRGTLPYLPKFGSRLHTLTEKTRTQEAVLTCIAEAMDGCETVQITRTTVTDDAILVEVSTPYGSGTITI